MPNPVLKYVTIFASAEGYGWSEIHYKPATVATPALDAALNTFVLGVVAARVPLLGEDCSVVGARVSYPLPTRIASYGIRQKFTGTAQQGSAAPSLSLAVNFKNADFTGTSITHLRGFWDAVEFDQSYRPDLAPGWDAAFLPWKNSLITPGYGWLSKDPGASAKGDVLSYASDADQRVTFLLKAPGMPAGVIGTRQQVRFSGFHLRRSILNRPLLVEVVDATHLKTVDPIGASSVSSTGKFNFRSTSFQAYAQTGSISLGERRMGKPLNRYPGRRAAQVLS